MTNVGFPEAVQEMDTSARPRTLGLEVVVLEIRRGEDIAPAFEQLNGRAQALYVCPDPLVFINRLHINTLAQGARLPTMVGYRDFVKAGALVSYGPDVPNMFRRAGDYVDKILRGAKPADLPVEQPTKFDLALNLITAKALASTCRRRCSPAPTRYRIMWFGSNAMFDVTTAEPPQRE